MAKEVIGDGNPDGTTLGASTSELISFHGVTPVAQTALTALATGATIATVVTSVQQIIAALQAKGLNG